MNTKLILLWVVFFFGFLSKRVVSEIHASVPPRGWNSYDSFCWTISEEEYLQNAQLISQKLHAHGYEYAVVDYLWYRKLVPGAYVDSLGYDVIDEWGRVIPDPGRWPSSKGGKGFKEVAKKVHDMGLKFGFHIMRGISTQAVNANTPILDITTGKAYVESGKVWHAKDIGITERACGWMKNGFMSVDTKLGAGRAFLKSLYHQYAEWDVDFLKHDCVFGDDFELEEITTVSGILKGLNRPIIYSLSPGTSATPSMAKQVAPLVNMYRVTGDDWDYWGDVASHFAVSRDFAAASLIGGSGLLGKSWPDLDMLPLGWLTDAGANEGPHRNSSLTLDEQKTQMTLWSMARSPLMFGGDMRKLDDTTYRLITNPTLLEINSFSSNNKEFPYITSAPQFQFLEEGVKFQTRSLKYAGESEKLILGLASCHDPKAKGWFSQVVDTNLEQVCWRWGSRSRKFEPFCLYKTESFLQSDEDAMYSEKYQGKLHLHARNRKGFCFDTSSKRKLTSNEHKRASFSPCRLDANQMWELSNNGTLVNSYSGSCASMKVMKANAVPGGIRSWIATGRRGEVYLAYFNLTPAKTVISTTVSSLTKAFPAINFGSCSCKEIWSEKDYGTLQHSLSASVESHGCALFILTCT
ncbi:melibiase family protein [Artemisia annua]|uniref:Alpha-galactosidase n=1 Tax=Artemisia annua TaxID=35608 RepID=A0A2U1QJA8_ARTAN|nr:melibiase family protein [Artemisia annua]